MKFSYITRTRPKGMSVRRACKLLSVSPSGYYKWASQLDSPRNKRNLTLSRAVEDIFKSSRGTYGSPRIYAQMRSLGFKVSRSKIERLMREMGLRAKTKRRFRATTQSKHNLPVASNILKRRFNQKKLNRVWASDITYISTREGWLYLAVIIDLCSRRVVGWSMQDRLTGDLASSALKMAFTQRKPRPGLIHHSDRGVQYASNNYKSILKNKGAKLSMSRKGNCWDNAPVESFFRSLKTELVYFQDYKSREEARQSVFEWIEVFYNRQRLHSTIGYKAPIDYERMLKSS